MSLDKHCRFVQNNLFLNNINQDTYALNQYGPGVSVLKQWASLELVPDVRVTKYA